MPKSLLQEYFQKNKYDVKLLKYDTVKVGGEDHKPSFKSILHLFENTWESDIFSTKKEAEMNVAEKVMNYLNSKKEFENVYKYPLHYDKIIFIDLENNPLIESPRDSALIGFTSNCSSIYQKREIYAKKCDLKIINSSIKDASDIYMVYYITRIITELHHTRNIPIYILTKDHFASAVVDIFKKEHKDIIIKHVTDVKDI